MTAPTSVSVEAREAAAKGYLASSATTYAMTARMIRAEQRDYDPFVQALARFEQTIRTDCAAREAAAVEAAYRKGLEDAAGVAEAYGQEIADVGRAMTEGECRQSSAARTVAFRVRRAIRTMIDTQDSRTTHAGEKP